jgi:hypothetical protein
MPKFMQKQLQNTKNEQYRPCYLYCTVATTIIDINDKRDGNEKCPMHKYTNTFYCA